MPQVQPDTFLFGRQAFTPVDLGLVYDASINTSDSQETPMRSILSLLVLLAIVTATPAQEDGFKRERTPKNAAGKDALEGKNPPRLSVAKWLNSKERLSLKKLKGKVVVLDFWGTW